MGTRSVIRIKRAELGSMDIYHHWDGYPEGVGFKLLNAIENYFDGATSAKVFESEQFANMLVKNTAGLDDNGFDVTLWKHGDIEYFYEIDFGKRDELNKEDALKAVKCWSVRFDFDGEYDDYHELKEEFIDLMPLYEQAKANAGQEVANG